MNIVKTTILLLCLLTAIGILTTAAAWAETDCQYNPLRKSRPTQILPASTASVLCGAEIATGAGAIVWEVRRNMAGYTAGNFARYCVEYSMYCPNIAWQKGCFCSKFPSSCSK